FQLSFTLCGSLIVPGCSKTPPGAAPLAKNFAPYFSVAITRPTAFLAIAIGEYPTKQSKPSPGILRTSSAFNAKFVFFDQIIISNVFMYKYYRLTLPSLYYDLYFDIILFVPIV